MLKNTKAIRPFGIRDKVGYLFGDFGNDFTFLLSSGFLLKFYTDVMGISAFAVGIVMMAARFVDAFTDVFMGRISDRSHITPTGKFKPWILRACGPVAIFSFLIYQSALSGAETWVKIVWLAITYILWGSVFYTMVNIPYGSMASAISREPDDRQALSTYRTVGSTLAGLIVGVGVPLFAYKTVDGLTVLDGPMFTRIAAVFSVLSIICYLLCYYLTTERVHSVHSDSAKVRGLGKLLVGAIKNRALISIIIASVIMLLAQLTIQSMSNYVYPNYYNSSEAQSASSLVMVIGMLLAAFLAKPFVRKFGKAEISAVANIFAGAICILLFFIRPENVWVYVLFNMISWIGLGIFAVVSWALITDVIDYSEIKNGVREDGSIYALYSFARKLGQAASAGLSGILLSLVGYSQENAFSPSVLDGIFNIATLLPGIAFIILGLILWLWYPLHKRKVEKNVEILRKKHEGG